MGDRREAATTTLSLCDANIASLSAPLPGLGKPVHLLGTETTILVKAGDRWTIVHVHWSSRQVK